MVVAVVAVLAAILIPTLARSRGAAHGIGTAAILRDHARVLHHYAADFSGYWPYLGDPGLPQTTLTGGDATRETGFFGVSYTWPVGLADGYYAGSLAPDLFMPPQAQPVSWPTLFLYSANCFTLPAFWRREDRTYMPDQLGGVRDDQTRFPSQKGLLTYRPYDDPNAQRSVALTDGSARATREDAFVSPYAVGSGNWGSYGLWGGFPTGSPVVHTVGGVAGRDLR